MEEFRNGNKEAFQYFYHLYHRGLYSFADRLTNNSEEAKDIVTESFVKLWRRCHEFKTVADVKPVLYTITRNACIDFLRLNQRQEQAHKHLSNLEQLNEDDHLQVSMARDEFFRKALAEVDKMPEAMREIFMLAYEEGLSTAEIAQKLNLAPDTVRVQKSRAIKMLKKILGDKGLLDKGILSLAFLAVLEAILHS